MIRTERAGVGVRGGSENARCQRYAQNCKHGKDCIFYCRISFVRLRRDRALLVLRNFGPVGVAVCQHLPFWQDRPCRRRTAGEASRCTSPGRYLRWPVARLPRGRAIDPPRRHCLGSVREPSRSARRANCEGAAPGSARQPSNTQKMVNRSRVF